MQELTLVKTVGASVRALRERRGLTQVALAKRAGVMRATLRRVESGEHAATLDTLDVIARALKVGVRDLLPPKRRMRR